jgi:hypothetical protein
MNWMATSMPVTVRQDLGGGQGERLGGGLLVALDGVDVVGLGKARAASRSQRAAGRLTRMSASSTGGRCRSTVSTR